MRKFARLKKFDEIAILAILIKSNVSSILDSKEHTSLFEYYSTLPDYLLKFTSLWVHTRCLQFGAAALERLHRHEEANDIYRFLLNSEGKLDVPISLIFLVLTNFNHNERGHFYNRLALNLASHLKNKSESLQICHLALADKLVPDKYKLALQDRIKPIPANFQPLIELQMWKTV
jgi:hypothetical protein